MTPTAATNEPSTKHSELPLIAVLGTGTMGRGIAQVAVQNGFAVKLFDAVPVQAERALQALHELFFKLQAKGKISIEQRDVFISRLEVAASLPAACAQAEHVIEAIFESEQAKSELWQQVDRCAPQAALFGTNTSSIKIARLACAVSDPSRFIGLHFFNPPALVPLLEIVVAPQTSADTVKRARRLAEQLQRQIVEVKDSPGFATSRLGVVLALEAIRMVEEGVASPADIDRAMEVGYGHAMGPLRTTDLVGLDVRLAIAETLQRELGNAAEGSAYEAPALLRKMVKDGKLGKKSKQGFYAWE